MTHQVTGNRPFGLAMLLVGVPWLYYSGDYSLGLIRETGFSAGLSFLFLVTLSGLFITLFGLSQLIYREEYRVGPDTVSWQRVGLTGVRAWQERVSRYKGVMKSQQYLRDSTQQAGPFHSRMSYSLYLDHADRSRRVRLYESENILESPGPDWERLWQHYGAMFNLPLLETTSRGVMASDAAKRGSPLAQQLADGSVIPVSFDLNAPHLPAGLALQRQDDLWVVSLRPVALLWSGITLVGLGVLLYGVAFALGWFADTVTTLAMGAVLFVGVLLYGLSMGKKFRHPDQAAVDAKSLWYRRWNHGKRAWDTDSVRLADIQRIALETGTDRHQFERVVVEAGSRTLAFGERLPARSRGELRDLLVYLVSVALAG